MNNAFHSLINHALETHLIEPCDKCYTENLLIAKLGLFEVPEKATSQLSFTESLRVLSNFAAENGIIENTLGEKDIFETELCGILTPRPSAVIEKFNSLYKESPSRATDYFYNLCRDTNYIRCEDIAKNVMWNTETSFGEIEITINLSKPEKDPRDIAKAAQSTPANYPKCALCVENEGYRGRANHPPRANLRIIPLTLNGENWGFQYSPYAYFEEHSILLHTSHRPMAIHRQAFANLLSFVKMFPDYFAGSNADLAIVGGSILSHEHYQCGHHTFPMMKAGVEIPLTFKGWEDIDASKVHWPMPTIRLKSKNVEKILDLSEKILTCWREYTDESAYVFAKIDNVPHNTITPIAWREGENFVLDLVLRNNITTPEHPMGLYHPHADKHNIKKENIGLIEVMGMAILPARLKSECEEMEKVILQNADPKDNEKTSLHAEWIKRNGLDKAKENTALAIKQAIGKTFLDVLIDAAVYKPTDEGNSHFMRFIDKVNSL